MGVDVVTQKARRDAFVKARLALAECRRRAEVACVMGRNIGSVAKDVADEALAAFSVFEKLVEDLEKTER